MVPPWELLDRPAYWIQIGLDAEQAEIGAQNVRVKSSNRGD
jgi:hypothetical protein